jgi:hypothetical protein
LPEVQGIEEESIAYQEVLHFEEAVDAEEMRQEEER